MIRLGLRFVPSHGRHDLAWLVRLTGSLLEIYEFLLRTEIGASLATDRHRRALSADETQLVIDGRALEAGSPLVKFRDGAVRLELATRAATTWSVQALASLALLLERGPERAAWPGHLSVAWFGEGQLPAGARRAYDWIRCGVVVQIVESRSLSKPAKQRRKKGERLSADLPRGVRIAPPL